MVVFTYHFILWRRGKDKHIKGENSLRLHALYHVQNYIENVMPDLQKILNTNGKWVKYNILIDNLLWIETTNTRFFYTEYFRFLIY